MILKDLIDIETILLSLDKMLEGRFVIIEKKILKINRVLDFTYCQHYGDHSTNQWVIQLETELAFPIPEQKQTVFCQIPERATVYDDITLALLELK